MLIVSHDRRFIDNGVTARAFEGSGKVGDYVGGSDYVRQPGREAPKTLGSIKNAPGNVKAGRESKKKRSFKEG